MYAEPDPLTGDRIKTLWRLADAVNLKPRALLDVGCGEGDTVASAEARGAEATGADISETAVERARQKHPKSTFLAFSAEAEPWPVAAGAFDLVASFEVIEHLVEPRGLVRGCHRALRPGGYVAISTPYHGLIKNLVLSAIAFDKHFAVEGDHIRFFTDAALRRLLEREGFDVKQFVHLGRAWGLWANTIVWAQKR